MVCTAIDLFIVNSPVWMAALSDGSLVYQDDGRPDVEPESAWIRLQHYISENSLCVTGLGLKFRTNTLWLPPNQDGYFFVKVAGADWQGPTIDYYSIGYLSDNRVYVKQYKLPELTLFQETSRSPDDCFEGTLIVNGQKTDQTLRL